MRLKVCAWNIQWYHDMYIVGYILIFLRNKLYAGISAAAPPL